MVVGDTFRNCGRTPFVAEAQRLLVAWSQSVH
jgi:hypothetical protein